MDASPLSPKPNESNAAQAERDVRLFSEESLRAQLVNAETKLGYKLVYFYIDERGILSKTKTDRVGQFYLSPSGGTLRDSAFNLVTYSARYDMYKGLGRA
jgi:hypothetical protein